MCMWVLRLAMCPGPDPPGISSHLFHYHPSPTPLSNLLWAKQYLRLKYSHQTKLPRLPCTAILESGVSVIAMSPKYNRPRGPKTKKPQPCLEPMSLDMEDSRQKEEIIEKYMPCGCYQQGWGCSSLVPLDQGWMCCVVVQSQRSNLKGMKVEAGRAPSHKGLQSPCFLWMVPFMVPPLLCPGCSSVCSLFCSRRPSGNF